MKTKLKQKKTVMWWCLLLFGAIVWAQDDRHYCQASVAMPDNSKPGFDLLQLSVLARHGARVSAGGNALPQQLQNVVWLCHEQDVMTDNSGGDAPVRKTYMKGRNALPGNCSLGQLTMTGAAQHVLLGQALRMRYADFLPARYNASVVFARSTDVERTVLSARSLFRGLFPDNSVPVELQTMDPFMDNAFPNPQLCPALGAEMYAAQTSDAYQSYYAAKLGGIAKKYSAIWNLNVTQDLMLYLNDDLRARVCANLSLPPNMTMDDADVIMHANGVLTNMQYSPFRVLQLSLSSFLDDLLSGLESNFSFLSYTVHDATLRVMLMAQQAYDSRWPSFASHIVVEKWRHSLSGKIFVTLSYDGELIRVPAPCNGTFCALDDLKTFLAIYRVPASACKITAPTI